MRVKLVGLLTAQAETSVVKFCKVTEEVLFCCLHLLHVEVKELFRNEKLLLNYCHGTGFF